MLPLRIREDIVRHSNLHSWYKLPMDGETFTIFFSVGEQPRNSVEPAIHDKTGFHLWMVRWWQPPSSCPKNAWTTVRVTRDFCPTRTPENDHEALMAARHEELMTSIVEASSQLTIDDQDRCGKAYRKDEEDNLQNALVHNTNACYHDAEGCIIL